MKIIITYKDGYKMTLNGVSDIQGGKQYICFDFTNEQVHKGNMVIEIAKIDNVRFE